MTAFLFTAAMLILDYEPSEAHRNGLVRLYTRMFKQFLGLIKEQVQKWSMIDNLLEIAEEKKDSKAEEGKQN